MLDVPDQVTVDSDEDSTSYVRAEGHFLAHLRPGASRDVASEAFAGAGLIPERPPEYVEASRTTLEPGGFLWVEVSGAFSDADAESTLEGRDEVDQVLPVYFVEGQGPESAAAPMVESITVLPEGDPDELVRELAGMGLDHDAAASGLLAPFHVFALPDEATAGQAFVLLDQVRSTSGVAQAELDWLKLQTYTTIPNDPLYANQWNLDFIDLPAGRDLEDGSSSVWIAAIDSGFDLAHPDLNFTPNTGTNLTHFNADQALAGNPPPYNASSVGVFHGTAVAGIAGALTDNSIGVASVGGGCSIMPVRLGTVPTANRVAAGVNWAANTGAAVATMSLGTTRTAAATAAVTNAWTAGLVICAATGNSGGNTTSPPVNFPANHPNVIAVGASDQDDERKRPASSDGENWGSQFDANTDVVAPGVLIWTTDEQGARGYNIDGTPVRRKVGGVTVSYPTGDSAGDYASQFNGTSAATPHVAGLAGLLLSANPSMTNQRVRDVIESTCDKISPAVYTYAVTPGRPNGPWHQEVGYGRINVRSALFAAVVSSKMVCGHTPKNVTDGWHAVEFGSGFDAPPVVLTSIESFDGPNPAGTRVKGVTAAGFSLKVEEEQSADDEVDHVAEVVGYVAVDAGLVLDDLGNVVGEAATVSVSQENGSQWHPVSLRRHYCDPVVVMQVMTYKGTQPCHTRLRNVTDGSFEFQIEEWDYLDQAHVTETVGYLVVEGRRHRLSSGKQIETGRVEVNHAWTTVGFGLDHASSPVTLSRCQTYSGPQAVVTRERSLSSSSFEVRLQEEEANDDLHRVEQVGYIAVKQP